MRKILFPALPLLFALCVPLGGCGAAQTTYVRSDATTLGRVVVYRNGVAYFERTAIVDDDTLKLSVPADKVDDFLKSLTITDVRTGQPAPVAYPTDAPRSATGLIEMKITLSGPRPHHLRLSYVTEAPSWKPSYRIVLGAGGKVDVEAWAVVDNTSGEDWKNVKLGVGSSSAMSFRFDLHAVRFVQREQLKSNDMFAQAPPMGGATYGGPPPPPGTQVVTELTDDSIAANEATVGDADQKAPVTKGVGGGPTGRGHVGASASATAAPTTAAPAKPMDPGANHGQGQQAGGKKDDVRGVARRLQVGGNQVVVEGYAQPGEADGYAASLQRANRVREQLVRNGLDPNRVVALGRGVEAGHTGGVRIVEAPPGPAGTPGTAPKTDAPAADPIGTSHFESGQSMSVPRGSSAMVSILHSKTDGEVVYLYDPESARGSTQFPFRAVRIKNPTDSALESGPVTVFGEGRFIGEGLCEPIPARSTAFVPFALDRQIVVEAGAGEHDDISRIITVQRGVFETEVQHTRKQTLVLHNRLAEKATVYLRHTVAPGYTLTKSPPIAEKISGAHLFKVELPAGGKQEVIVEEATPLFKTADIRSPGGMEMVRVYLSEAAAHGPLKAKVAELIKLQQDIGNLEQRITTMREQMGEYRMRMDELHIQIVTLRAVKSAGPLMQSLEKKMTEVSDRLSKSTIDLVGFQEKLMIARVNFQDGVADLSLEPKEKGTAVTSK